MNYTKHIFPRRKEVAKEYICLIREFLKSKYARQDVIDCRFDLYHIDFKSKRRRIKHCKFDKRIIPLSMTEYTQLMVVLLAFPDITFQDLPMYIPLKLYDQLLVLLRFPRYSHICNLSMHPNHSQPVAVEMTTLQRDAREIAGEDIYSFGFPLKATGPFEEISIHLERRLMDVTISMIRNGRLVNLYYKKIDAIAVEQILNVNDFRGIERELTRVYEQLANNANLNIFWIVQWLDENSLKYIYSEEYWTED